MRNAALCVVWAHVGTCTASCGCPGSALVLPTGITEIPPYAYYGCSGLSSLDFSAARGSLTIIDQYAFTDTAVVSSTIPTYVTQIGVAAFNRVTALTSLDLTQAVALLNIGANAFRDTAITSLIVPDALTAIGNNAFLNIASLTSVVLGASVANIGSDAFHPYDTSTLFECFMFSGATPPWFDSSDKTLPGTNPSAGLCPAQPSASITGDPHVRGADGDSFDFKGEHLGIYVLLSTKLLSLAAQFEHSRFFTPHSKLWVHGSWMRQLFWTIRTRGGRLLQTQLDSRRPTLNGSAVTRTVIIEDIRFAFKAGHGHGTLAVLTVTTAAWRTRAEVTKGAPHRGHLRINVQLQPLHDIATDAVAPHGIIGQTYDGDGLPKHGRRDRYDVLDDGTPTAERRTAGGIVTTRAKGERAIEGTAEMYRVDGPYDTGFVFSRFDAAVAKIRNVTLLGDSK